MTTLLDRVAPLSYAVREEWDWEEECESALKAHPVFTFASALLITGIGLVSAVAVFTLLTAVPLCVLAGIL